MSENSQEILSSANALLRQCENVKHNAQHAMNLSGVTAEEVQQARNSTATSPFLQQLKQSTRLDTILARVTAEALLPRPNTPHLSGAPSPEVGGFD
jgi:hypothetical protein